VVHVLVHHEKVKKLKRRIDLSFSGSIGKPKFEIPLPEKKNPILIFHPRSIV
jgi:hypothetical protein